MARINKRWISKHSSLNTQTYAYKTLNLGAICNSWKHKTPFKVFRMPLSL